MTNSIAERRKERKRAVFSFFVLLVLSGAGAAVADRWWQSLIGCVAAGFWASLLALAYFKRGKY